MTNENRFKTLDLPRTSFVFLAIITIILVGAVLKISTPVILPFVISVLMTFVLEPVVNLLHRFRIPRVLAIIIIIIMLAGLVYILGLIVFSSGRLILSQYPRYEARFLQIYGFVAETFNLSFDRDLSLTANLLGQESLRGEFQRQALRLSEGFFKFMSSFVMVSLFTFMLLLEMGQFKRRFELAFEGDAALRIQKIGEGIVTHVARYLSVKFLISLITGILVGLGFWAVGLDFWIIWAILAFILNFIPTIGSIVAGGGAVVFALVQFWPDPIRVILVLLTSGLVNFVLGNIMEPRIMGDNLGLSPFIILLSLLGWGWLWGFPGLVLAVPMTVIGRIVCDHIPFLEPVSILMGNLRSANKRTNAIAVVDT